MCVGVHMCMRACVCAGVCVHVYVCVGEWGVGWKAFLLGCGVEGEGGQARGGAADPLFYTVGVGESC